MTRQILPRALIMAAAVALVTVNIYVNFVGAGLPFTFQIKDASTAVVQPIPGVPLPPGIQPGDEIDIPALDSDARSVLLASGFRLANMTEGVEYRMAIRHAGVESTVTFTTRGALRSSSSWHYMSWVAIFFQCVLLAVVLITLWVGQDRSARFIGLWAFGYIAGDTCVETPFSGHFLYYSYMLSWVIYFLARLSLYAAAESMAGGALSRVQRLLLRACVASAVAVGLVASMGGGYLLVEHGSLAWLHAYQTWLVTLPYMVAWVTLLVAQRRATGAHRIRVQWMMWSLLPFIVGILARTVPGIIGRELGIAINTAGLSLGLMGTLYALFRHRVVDARKLLDRTLVYGSTTSLVIGLIAAMNSLALRMTLSQNASLLLQIIVPLSLGIVLGKVQDWMEKFVEQVFFRRQYQRDQTLRFFAARAAHFDSTKDLLDATVREIAREFGSPAIAVYAAHGDTFRRMRHMGHDTFPAKIGVNDDAVLALKTYGMVTELRELSSALGADGCIVPMLVHGDLLGLMVLRNRAGQKFASDERDILNFVAGAVASTWRNVLARANEDLVVAMAKGSIESDDAFGKARRLYYSQSQVPA